MPVKWLLSVVWILRIAVGLGIEFRGSIKPIGRVRGVLAGLAVGRGEGREASR